MMLKIIVKNHENNELEINCLIIILKFLFIIPFLKISQSMNLTKLQSQA